MENAVVKKPKLRLGSLDGPDGNVFAIIGKAKQVARENNMDWNKIEEEAWNGDYDNVFKVLKKYFDVE